jgi:hypothetical protein
LKSSPNVLSITFYRKARAMNLFTIDNNGKLILYEKSRNNLSIK